MKPHNRFLNLILISVLLFLLVGFKAHSTTDTITVNTTDDQYGSDSEHCSLREAISTVNTHMSYGGCIMDFWSSVNTISLGPGTYAITRAGAGEENTSTGDLDIKPQDGNTITIVGVPQETVVDGGGLDRVFDVKAATGSSVYITDLRITNGYVAENGGGIRNAGNLFLQNVRVDNNHCASLREGGGIYNSGTLSINLSRLESNYIDANSSNNNDSGDGGAIYNAGTLSMTEAGVYNNHAGDFNLPSGSGWAGRGGGMRNAGTATIEDSTIAYNSSGTCLVASMCLAGSGGGINNFQGQLTLENSTVSNNTTGNSISGASRGGGIWSNGTVNLYDSTIAYNTLGTGDADNRGGGIYDQGNTNMRNSILSNNDSGSLGMECTRVYNPIHSLDYNLIKQLDETCDVDGTVTHNIYNQAAQLSALGEYGGTTETHMLRWNSPALDHGDPVNCPDDDQRGVTRPLDGDFDGNAVCDIGAVEDNWAGYFFLPLIRKMIIED